MVPSAVMEMLRAPGLGQWWEVVQGALKREGGCVKCMCVAYVCVWECNKCVGVCVCVGLCALADLSALPLMCEGRHWDWLDQSRLLLVTRSVPTPHCTHTLAWLSQRLHTHTRTHTDFRHSDKERGKAPQWQKIFYPLQQHPVFFWVRLNQTEIFVCLFLRGNSGMCSFHVWGGSTGPLYTMGPLWRVPVSMVLRGSPRLEEGLCPPFWLKLISLCNIARETLCPNCRPRFSQEIPWQSGSMCSNLCGGCALQVLRLLHILYAFYIFNNIKKKIYIWEVGSLGRVQKHISIYGGVIK